MSLLMLMLLMLMLTMSHAVCSPLLPGGDGPDAVLMLMWMWMMLMWMMWRCAAPYSPEVTGAMLC